MSSGQNDKLEREFYRYAGMRRAADALKKAMPTGSEVSMGIAALRGLAGLISRLQGVITKTGNLEADEILVEIGKRLVEANQVVIEKDYKILELEKKNFELEKRIQELQGEKPELKNETYWKNGKGPYCTLCYDKYGRYMLTQSFSLENRSGCWDYDRCPDCKTEFYYRLR